MRGSDLAEAMASAVDRIVSACEGTGALDRAIEAGVGTIDRFSGKDATSYLASYRAEMVSSRIPSSGDARYPYGGSPGTGREPDLGGVRRSAPRKIRA